MFEKIKEFGIQIALDEFGSGAIQFQLLQDIPFDYIKLDRTLISAMDNHIDDEAQLIKMTTFLKSIIELGHAFQSKLIGVGIESASQNKILKELSCDFGQGYLYCYPEAEEKLQQLFDSMKNSVGYQI